MDLQKKLGYVYLISVKRNKDCDIRFADGILIANIQFISKDIDDACRKIAKVSNVGGAIYSVDDGRLTFRFKEVCRGNKSR